MVIREVVAGQDVEVETFDDWVSPVDVRSILRGRTYTVPDELAGVRVVLDVGANVGATSVYFACLFPEAEVHAFEPAEATFRLLEKNARPFPSIRPHHHGLLDRDADVDLFHGAVGPGQASIHGDRDGVRSSSERVQVRSAGEWLKEQAFERIDVLKIDTEGCEVAIIESMREWLGGVRVVYFEFHSREDRARLEAVLSETHTLVLAKQFYETGELTYTRSDVTGQLRPGFVRRVFANEAS